MRSHDILFPSLIFWIVGFHNGRIERGDMNGDAASRRSIVKDLKAPTALTVSYH